VAYRQMAVEMALVNVEKKWINVFEKNHSNAFTNLARARIEK
jgi:hypothetical protein